MGYLRCLILLVISGVLAACTSFSLTKNFTETGEKTYDSFPDNCKVTIYATPPKKEFDELGIIDIEYFCRTGFLTFTKCPKMNKASYVRDYVRNDVCEAGGNAILLWEANGYGQYTKTTVIRVK